VMVTAGAGAATAWTHDYGTSNRTNHYKLALSPFDVTEYPSSSGIGYVKAYNAQCQGWDARLRKNNSFSPDQTIAERYNSDNAGCGWQQTWGPMPSGTHTYHGDFGFTSEFASTMYFGLYHYG
jgi:hypothetical protein